jgi:hypothetical protein
VVVVVVVGMVGRVWRCCLGPGASPESLSAFPDLQFNEVVNRSAVEYWGKWGGRAPNLDFWASVCVFVCVYVMILVKVQCVLKKKKSKKSVLFGVCRSVPSECF